MYLYHGNKNFSYVFSSLYLTQEDREVRGWKSKERKEGEKDGKKEGIKAFFCFRMPFREKENLV